MKDSDQVGSATSATTDSATSAGSKVPNLDARAKLFNLYNTAGPTSANPTKAADSRPTGSRGWAGDQAEDRPGDTDIDPGATTSALDTAVVPESQEDKEDSPQVAEATTSAKEPAGQEATGDDTDVAEEVIIQYVDEDGNPVDEHGNPLEATVADDKDPEKSSEWFIEARTGSKYRDAAETVRGIEEKDRYIEALEAQVGQLSAYKATADMYEGLLTEDQLIELTVKSRLPQEFRDVKEEDIEDADTLRKYAHALERARFDVERELGDSRRKADSERESLASRHKEGVEFIRAQLVDKNVFDVRNVEQRHSLGVFLDEKVSGDKSRIDVAHHLAMTMGKDHAHAYLRGLKAQYWGTREDKVVREVRTIVKKVKPQKVAVARTPEQGPVAKEDPKPPVPKTPADKLRSFYGETPTQRRRRTPSFGS